MSERATTGTTAAGAAGRYMERSVTRGTVTSAARRYRMEIVASGKTVDLELARETGMIYEIETWTFRLLDGDSLRDYIKSEPKPFDTWEWDYVDIEAWEADRARRAEARGKWEREIIRMLTGKDRALEESTTWTVERVLTEIFTAVVVRRIDAEATA